MEVFVVVSNNVDQVMGEIDGVFQNFKDAKKMLDSIKDDWMTWANEGDVEQVTEQDDYFSLETADEYMEVMIIRKELQ